MIEMEYVFFIFIGLCVWYAWFSKKSQLRFIEGFQFNPAIGKKVQVQYPHLKQQDIDLVMSALKDYFQINRMAKGKMVSMPSQVVDVAWHEFILFTRAYEAFCHKALGRFLHHTPAEAMKKPTRAQAGIKRAWRLACAKQKINPTTPNRLPLLFAIDAELDIEGGFTYALNCRDKSSPHFGVGHCATHIGCASGCAGSSGSAARSGGFFDGFGGDSSGCSGGGCGGD